MVRRDKLFGYAGKILSINLTDGTIQKIAVTPEFVDNYIGGFGFTAKLAYDSIPAGIDPLSPQNALVFGAPILGGTFAPTGGRTVVMGKSPVTGYMGVSHMGEPGAMMKFAGYDQLIITGRAAVPSYIRIENDDVRIVKADHIWGLGIPETVDNLWRELGGEFYVSCIGPAGENLVRFANIITNKYSAAGRCGLGAVMGSKNLKAVAVFGDQPIEVARPGQFARICNEVIERLREDPYLDNRRRYGSLMALPYQYPRANWRLRHHRDGSPVEITEVFDLEQYHNRIRERNVTCFACPIGCKQEIKVKQGEFAGANFALSCAMGTMVRPFSLQLAVNKYEDVAKCAQLNNSYGMDSHVIDHTIKLFIELQQQGIVTPELTDGMTLEWGDTKTIIKLLHKIAHREGIGNIMAEGPVGACRKLGIDPDEHVIHVKGNPITPLMDPRIDFGPEELGACIGPRKGHFDYHRPIGVIKWKQPYSLEYLRKECERLGVPEEAVGKVINGQGRWGWNVAQIARYVELYSILTYSLGICEAVFNSGAYDIRIYTDLFNALTGAEMPAKTLLRAAERIWNLQRMFNVREGHSRKDDQLARIYTHTKLITVGKEFPPVSEEKFNGVLDEYYAACGWDTEGRPTKEKLSELALSY